MNLMRHVEDAARLAMGDMDEQDHLPPGPNYGPFGYYRLGILILLAVVVIILLLNVL